MVDRDTTFSEVFLSSTFTSPDFELLAPVFSLTAPWDNSLTSLLNDKSFSEVISEETISELSSELSTLETLLKSAALATPSKRKKTRAKEISNVLFLIEIFSPSIYFKKKSCELNYISSNYINVFTTLN